MKNQDKEKNINPVAAIATGVVIGAGAALAGAAVLSDKKNQEKIKKVIKDVKKQVIGYAEDTQKNASNKKDEGKEKITQGKEDLKKIADSTKDILKDEGKRLSKSDNSK
jgi:hypothetical protein